MAAGQGGQRAVRACALREIGRRQSGLPMQRAPSGAGFSRSGAAAAAPAHRPAAARAELLRRGVARVNRGDAAAGHGPCVTPDNPCAGPRRRGVPAPDGGSGGGPPCGGLSPHAGSRPRRPADRGAGGTGPNCHSRGRCGPTAGRGPAVAGRSTAPRRIRIGRDGQQETDDQEGQCAHADSSRRSRIAPLTAPGAPPCPRPSQVRNILSLPPPLPRRIHPWADARASASAPVAMSGAAAGGAA